jgi:uncharacterized membrane protein HdeD (DUF308 family)
VPRCCPKVVQATAATRSVDEGATTATKEEEIVSILQVVNKNATTAKWVGIVIVIAGFLSLIAPLAGGLSITVIVGTLILLAGVMQLLLVFRAGTFGQGLLLALLGLLGVVAGGYTLMHPAAALAALTLLLSAWFVASGAIESIAALTARDVKGWGWILFSGVVSVLLGLMLWSQFPLSGAWAVGTLVGVRLLFSGFALISAAGAVSSAVKEST